jgi:hypothetical protein
MIRIGSVDDLQLLNARSLSRRIDELVDDINVGQLILIDERFVE